MRDCVGTQPARATPWLCPAGGDAVSGAATVILAMGAGRKAAKAIMEALG